jgi:hypothetical protein
METGGGDNYTNCYISNSNNPTYLSAAYLKVIIEGYWRRDSSVGIATGYGLDDRGTGVRLPGG